MHIYITYINRYSCSDRLILFHAPVIDSTSKLIPVIGSLHVLPQLSVRFVLSNREYAIDCMRIEIHVHVRAFKEQAICPST